MQPISIAPGLFGRAISVRQKMKSFSSIIPIAQFGCSSRISGLPGSPHIHGRLEHTMMRFFLAIILASTASAADPAGFSIWKPSELEDRARNAKVGPDHAAREVLGDYGNQRVRLLHRLGDGVPEMHDNFNDLWIVISGDGTLVVGGKIADAKERGAGSGEYAGTRIDGGERHTVTAGDIIHIPAKTPHQMLVATGKEITYVAAIIPDK